MEDTMRDVKALRDGWEQLRRIPNYNRISEKRRVPTGVCSNDWSARLGMLIAPRPGHP
jgi:hypothetical protein